MTVHPLRMRLTGNMPTSAWNSLRQSERLWLKRWTVVLKGERTVHEKHNHIF